MNRKEFLDYIGKGLFFSGSAMFLASCNSFLTEKPKALLSPDTFFNSDAAADAAVIGMYQTLHSGNIYGLAQSSVYAVSENGADTMGPDRTFGGVEFLQNYVLNEGTTNIRGIWLDLYNLIYNANLVLSKINDNKQMTKDGIDKSTGETLFLRSLAYFHLTNFWGDVPFYTDNLPLDQIQKLGRTDKGKIRTQIVQDLKKAYSLLPPSYSADQIGRATKWAAETLLTKTYLWMGNWQGARDSAVDIINNSPHQLLKNYADVFSPDNTGNAELIFQVVWAKDLLQQRFTDFFTPRIRDEPKNGSDRSALQADLDARNEGFTGYGLTIPLPDLVSKYPQNDLRRPSNVVTSYLGYDLKFQYMPKMWDLDQINSPRGNHGNNFIVFRLADVYLMAAEAENELNGPGNAYQYINAVRARAYNPVQPLSGMSQAQFRQAIYDERKWELAGEGYRRIDLVRWGILLDVVKNAQYRVYDPAANITPKNVMLPIPATEIDLNPELLKSDPTNNGYR